MGRARSSDDDFAAAVGQSHSIREALGRLGLAPAGGNYKEFKKRLARLGLDASHFSGQGHRRGKRVGRPLAAILVEESSYTNNNRLRIRLINEGILAPKCSECGIDRWRGKPITLHLDHMNGINNDHRIGNLRLLCPNCHSQTATYCGRNKGNPRGG